MTDCPVAAGNLNSPSTIRSTPALVLRPGMLRVRFFARKAFVSQTLLFQLQPGKDRVLCGGWRDWGLSRYILAKGQQDKLLRMLRNSFRPTI